MGNKKRRLAKFLAEHPTCCFCGGESKAETEDHIPSRSIFLGRIWPKGYVFPACIDCNKSSADDEAIIAMFSRFDPLFGDAESEESQKLVRAFSERNPNLLKKMMPTSNEVRRSLKKIGLAKPEGIAYGEIPIVKMPPEIREMIKHFGEKLIKALHYKHTRRIVPKDAGMIIFVHPNTHHMTGKYPNEVLNIFNRLALPSRDTTPLHDQFYYSYSVSDDGTLGGYVVMFRKAFSITGFLSFDATWIFEKEDLLNENLHT